MITPITLVNGGIIRKKREYEPYIYVVFVAYQYHSVATGWLLACVAGVNGEEERGRGRKMVSGS